MTIERLGLKAKNTTELAATTTALSPRFYTTDFEALDGCVIRPR
jgi:magnesium-protoporphyrin IX monomethyl ester (oxidative) cyclase